MYESLTNLLREGNRIVFFGGAGVSTESGIPDFRSVNGLYRQTYRFPPETILSHTFFRKHPEEFFHFYRERMLCLSAQPNQAHRALAKLEQMGSFPQSLPKISTVCINQLAAKKSMNSTALFCEIPVSPVEKLTQ